MTHRPAIGKRKQRADAIRNRERVLEAAKAVFSQGGPEASLEAVARQAGVGIGTLYRHFPTREDLYEAVYRHEVEQLVELAKHLAAETAPVEALRRWLQAGVEFMATKKGIAALAMAADRFRIPQRHSALAAGTGAHAPLPSLPRTSRKVSAGSRAVCLGEYQARGWALKIVGRQPQLLLI
jgi:AcrR family transcriptional regulator